MKKILASSAQETQSSPFPITFITTAEQSLLDKSSIPALRLPGEKLPIIQVPNAKHVGGAVAWLFLEFVSKKPAAIISLPTGRTPREFIEYLRKIKAEWDSPDFQTEKNQFGFQSSVPFPDTSRLTFFQMDEYVGADPTQSYSYASQVRHNYQRFLGIPDSQFHTIDTSAFNSHYEELKGKDWLRNPSPEQEQVIATLKDWCTQYQKTIDDKGGLDFALLGLGPDGHFAFNMPSVSLNPEEGVRLDTLTYATAAANSPGNGHVDRMKDRLVATMGPGTFIRSIQDKPDARLIVFATGNKKGKAVTAAITQPQDLSTCPASVLQQISQTAMFILDDEAAFTCDSRVAGYIQKTPAETLPPKWKCRTLSHLCKTLQKPLSELEEDDFKQTLSGQALLKKHTWPSIKTDLIAFQSTLEGMITAQSPLSEGDLFNTEPHDDDLLLGVYPLMIDHLRKNPDTFSVYTATPGFTSVTSEYISRVLERIPDTFATDPQYEKERALVRENNIEGILHHFEEAFEKSPDVYTDPHMQFATALMMLVAIQRTLGEGCDSITQGHRALMQTFNLTTSPGDPLPENVKKLKTHIRALESKRVWYFAGIKRAIDEKVLRESPSYYKGIANESLPNEEDVEKLARILAQKSPTLITFTDDAEGNGPSTHYRVTLHLRDTLDLCMKAARSPHDYLSLKNRDEIAAFGQKCLDGKVTLYGYRNVWSEYGFHELNTGSKLCPLTQEGYEMTDKVFRLYESQVDAPCPSIEHAATFSEVFGIKAATYKTELECLLGKETVQRLAQTENLHGFMPLSHYSPCDFVSTFPSILERRI